MAVNGLQGNFQAQPRVFGHSASLLSGSATQITGTEERGCCLFIGTGGDIEVILEGNTTSVTFKNVPLCSRWWRCTSNILKYVVRNWLSSSYERRQSWRAYTWAIW